MLRTRLYWFSIGFATTAASISQFVWRDLLAYRYALSSDVSFALTLNFFVLCSFSSQGGFQIVIFDVLLVSFSSFVADGPEF